MASTTILSLRPYAGEGAQQLTSERVRGSGYYGSTNLLYSLQLNIDNFAGSIEIQASLELSPTEGDWFGVPFNQDTEFTMDTTGLVRKFQRNSTNFVTPTSGVFGYSFIGNYVWLRVKISNWTGGTVNSIILMN
jgi:hypothetical protein